MCVKEKQKEVFFNNKADIISSPDFYFTSLINKGKISFNSFNVFYTLFEINYSFLKKFCKNYDKIFISSSSFSCLSQ